MATTFLAQWYRQNTSVRHQQHHIVHDGMATPWHPSTIQPQALKARASNLGFNQATSAHDERAAFIFCWYILLVQESKASRINLHNWIPIC